VSVYLSNKHAQVTVTIMFHMDISGDWVISVCFLGSLLLLLPYIGTSVI